jgi:5-methylcytosine-specific restriction endonuclease McrA
VPGWTAKERQWRIQAIIRRDGKRCWLCGDKFGKTERGVTIDHAIPKSRGGTNHLSNLRLAHRRCNHERADIARTSPKAAQIRLAATALPMSVLELTPDMIVGSAELSAAA